jgi:hypothetical protein
MIHCVDTIRGVARTQGIRGGGCTPLDKVSSYWKVKVGPVRPLRGSPGDQKKAAAPGLDAAAFDGGGTLA